jgi:hypothetical protein
MTSFLRSGLCALLLLAGAGMPAQVVTENSEYLNTVQQHTFRWFWEFAHPASGMIPERTATPNICTSGGTGFGVMAIIAGAERGWVSREQAVERLLKMTAFLEQCERFHGAWPHWLDGNTGKTVPFSRYDDGGDLVETAYLINGLLAARTYFNGSAPAEAALRSRITHLWESVEWSWYVRNGLLHWHWSPRHEWKMNHPIGGYNECLITYVLALGSPAFPIAPEVYQRTWKEHEPGHYKNGKTYLGYTLPLGFDWGGPLFFAHYSYLSLDPRLMQDGDANYWQLNVSQTLINRAYCIEQAPKEFGYSEHNWGLTASDNFNFYGAHAPVVEDNSTITPTAALSSFPYTPWYSMQALKYLYRIEGNRLFGPHGFYDAYSKLKGWYSNQYLAIDQGPIVVMIENYRSGLFWALGQRTEALQAGLAKMGIRRPEYPTGFYMYIPEARSQRTELMKHPDHDQYFLDFWVKGGTPVSVELRDAAGKAVQTLQAPAVLAPGPQQLRFLADPGLYEAVIRQGSAEVKMGLRLW